MIVNDQYYVDNYDERERLISLSPSDKFILYLLKHKGPLKNRDLLYLTLLPKRTIAYSLKKLQDQNFVKKRIDKKDKRIRIYEAII
jgi:phosphosulfolactate synthase